MATLLVLIYAFFTASTTAFSAFAPFVPQDNFLIDTSADKLASLPDGRVFRTEEQSKQFLEAKDEIKVSVEKADVPSPIYLSARIFVQEAIYSFPLSRPAGIGTATFSVSTDKYVLLHSFNMNYSSKHVLKEFLLNVTEPHFSIKFVPIKNSAAFINATEVVAAPDELITEVANGLLPVGEVSGLSAYAYQTMYRLNMGGPLITSGNDTLGRTWQPDASVSVSTTIVKYPEGVTPLIAPQTMYASAVEMADAKVSQPNFNVTWNFEADPGFGYLIRLHFCDIVSKALNNLYFNVYINGEMAISDLDLSHNLNGLAMAYYKDIVVNASLMSNGLTVQIDPSKLGSGDSNAILNGLEVFKISSSVNSLDREFGVEGSMAADGSNRSKVAAVGFAMMFGAFIGLGAMVMKRHKRPPDWRKRNSFSSWLLPLHASDTSFMTSKNSMGSHKSNFYSSTMGLGRYISFTELQEATKNFDFNAVIGVGGFGNVYLGVIDDGTKVAVKRGNPQSEQGITEFQTEIQMLSKLRHRHLVSLIGYCDENSEMILVYEYMSNGPFRDHLYGKDLPPLSWKQRLEICIGSARGLHYLHTGTAQGIIHRDVKTTNILLDENFPAKVADFGLLKDAPMGQGHVNPEYFRRQQLTDKSDVYSFGVVLLEVLCARPAINPALPREQVNLADWAMQWKRKGLIDKITDPLLVGSINPESMKKFAEASEKCLAEHGVDRPTMGDVLWNLEFALQLQETFSQGNAEDDKSKSNSSAIVSTSPAVVTSSTTASTSDSLLVSTPEEHESPAQAQAMNGHSGTAMFSQFANLNGR
ncbi:hypothetical protein CIPAW_06G132500 [Carya illinoinensis]|uniref:Protein kinase domain-containing protein n=1 Tax=Carya illinoinensis TaxID=32201 RepID=A0A8T1QBH4_CARIL|nr:hypothetical protein CIPAW_06G132500 [Carya illinoinensis]